MTVATPEEQRETRGMPPHGNCRTGQANTKLFSRNAIYDHATWSSRHAGR
jgi:hypothetical protein